MHVLIAPDRLDLEGRIVSAPEIAAALASGWSAARALDEVVLRPLSTGDGGLVQAAVSAFGGDPEPALLSGPLGERVPITWWTDGDAAYLDGAALLGPPTSPAARDLAVHGSSAGVGELILTAVAAGCRRIVVGVGDSGTHDGGVGALRALAGGDVASLPEVMERARTRLHGVDVVVAAATDRPLVGLSGSGAALAGRPGINPGLAQEVEQSILGAVAQIEAATQRPTSLLAPSVPQHGQQRGSRRPRSGAGGGLAFALEAIGARLRNGADLIADATALPRDIGDADVVLTAATTLDGTAMELGVPGAVGRLAMERMVPVVALGVDVRLSRRELAGTGVEAVYPLHDQPSPGTPVPVADLDALSRRASRVARTWSR